MKLENLWSSTPTRFVICRCFALWARKPTNSRRGLASPHLAPDVAVSIMHSDCFKLKGLFCLCNPYSSVASAKKHRTRVLQARLRLPGPDQTPEIQVLRFTNVVWLHYRAALMHKILSVPVNVINNIMRIHCLLMIGSVLSNDFPLIFIIIGNVLGLRCLTLLDRRGDGIRTFTTKRISKAGRYPMAVI